MAEIRIGRVTATDKEKIRATVWFEEQSMASGSLRVLQRPGPITVSKTTLSYDGQSKEHTHTAESGYWLPEVGDVVACLITSPSGAGFVLGKVVV